MADTARPCYRSISIVSDGRLGVCDGAHWAFVMKKGGADCGREDTRGIPGLKTARRGAPGKLLSF